MEKDLLIKKYKKEDEVLELKKQNELLKKETLEIKKQNALIKQKILKKQLLE